MSLYFINGWENAHFLGPMRTKCGPKYQKSPQCGPNASFADLFGNTANYFEVVFVIVFVVNIVIVVLIFVAVIRFSCGQ